jgi:hypothetical protein
MIVCDGCATPLSRKGEIHEWFNADHEPEYCGRGVVVSKKDYETWRLGRLSVVRKPK